MATGPIFISHSSDDDAFVRDLRLKLESQGLTVWMDSRQLRGGSKLTPQLKQAIAQARAVIAVLSPYTINSPWVTKEIRCGLQVERKRQQEGYRVIPLLLPGIKPTALHHWFDEEPVAVPVETKLGGLSEALPRILAGLGEHLPDDHQPQQAVPTKPLAELLLSLADPAIETAEGKHQFKAIATLEYQPVDPSTRTVESERYLFTAPLGPIEADDLHWYLESYHLWPTGVFQERARRIEAQLPQWGQALYCAALDTESARGPLTAWQQAAAMAERRFSVLVDRTLLAGTNEAAQAKADEAASGLLALPWELLHDGHGYLFQGAKPVQVRRRLPNRRLLDVALAKFPVRILLVSPRPEEEGVGYIDHRISALPLTAAVEHLGELAELTVLTPPTFPALAQALKTAREAGKPFDVVHFDGHGIYDRGHGLGALCFEDPQDKNKLAGRRMQLVYADKLATTLCDYRVPLVFLEACQSAKTEGDPMASVAARLLEEGVVSVIAMNYSVLVETAQRFVEAFYSELARGARVGQAMLAGQMALSLNTYRLKIMGAGELHLQDWFVPVLYQEQKDPQLFTRLPAEATKRLQEKAHRLSLGRLPEPPPQTFIGRSRELLALERSLVDHPYVLIRGQGGAGKTTLAVELARWLVRTQRFERAAFVNVEEITEPRAVLDNLGRQLLPEGDNWSVAQYRSLKEPLQLIQRAISDRATLLVLDNLESVLPDSSGQNTAIAPVEELFDLCRELLEADPRTRLLLTSREPLPEIPPFDKGGLGGIFLTSLSREDAIELVSRVLADEGLELMAADLGGTAQQQIIDLVEAANRHARALVLLAREVAHQGVKKTTTEINRLMSELDRRYPGDRENSLYASVELSLRRLSPETRQRCQVLGVFHGGANIKALIHGMGMDFEAARKLAAELIRVGLAEDAGDGHLRLDSALFFYLRRGMTPEEQAHAEDGWDKGMMMLTEFIYRQQFQDAELAARLTRLEMSNLLALLDRLQITVPAEQLVSFAATLEDLLAPLGQPWALARAAAAREQAMQDLEEWSHDCFIAESHCIERLLDDGNRPAAVERAKALLQRCLENGANTYPLAAYDTAMAHWLLGRVLNRSGAAAAALPPLAEARRCFEILANSDTDAERMTSVVITEIGDCLMALGRLKDAEAAYQDAIERDEKRGATRDVAVGKAQLGTVYLEQGRYDDALTTHHEARKHFETLGEPRSVATAWYQIGRIYSKARQFERAEQAYQKSLAIRVQHNFRADQAASLGGLGNLYDAMGRWEEAARFHQQAANICMKLPDLNGEGQARHNLAITLISLRRFDEARRELHRAIECKKPYGHAAEPWKTWEAFHKLERDAGNPEATTQAWREAKRLFLAYRRDGGENHTFGAQLCARVAQGIREGNTAVVARELDALASREDLLDQYKTLISKLQAILAGTRGPILADDTALYYRDAVELQLLLEGL